MMVLRVVFAHGAAVSIFKLRRHSLVKKMEHMGSTFQYQL